MSLKINRGNNLTKMERLDFRAISLRIAVNCFLLDSCFAVLYDTAKGQFYRRSLGWSQHLQEFVTLIDARYKLIRN